jgi:hypothetical protein
MTGEWTTRRSGWPTNQPVWMIAACVLAALTIPALLGYQYRENWTALQRYYLGSYLRSRVLATGPLARLRRHGTEYRMIDAIDRKHQRPAMNEEERGLMAPGLSADVQSWFRCPRLNERRRSPFRCSWCRSSEHRYPARTLT